MKLINNIFFLFLIFNINAQTQRELNFNHLISDFMVGYTSLEIAPLQLSYASNLKSIKSLKKLRKQETFFLSQKTSFSNINRRKLNDRQQLDLDILEYEIDLNLERISIEKKWMLSKSTIKETKLLDERYGKKWYEYFLKKWIDLSVTPEEMYNFGVLEIKNAKREIQKLQSKLKMNEKEFYRYINDKKFFITSKEEVQKRYDSLKIMINKNAGKYFPSLDKVHEISIEKGTNKSFAIAPAYYINNTFYYNFFDDNYDTKTMGWTYVHEAIPGHHYQTSITSLHNRSKVQNLFKYYSFIEGWGAYVEQLGAQLGIYNHLEVQYGQLEWDLIRSIRVVLDVGLNYYGWSDNKALNFWRQHMKNNDTIAIREISRIKRWPAQVISYKYGAKVLNDLKKLARAKEPSELKKFHSKVLKHGDLPFSILKKKFNLNK